MSLLGLPILWGGFTKFPLERGRSWISQHPATGRTHDAPLSQGDAATERTGAKARPDNRHLDDAMDRYARGNDAAFGEIYDGLAHRLYGYLVRQCRNAGLAEELVQQTFLQMHRARGQFVRGAPVLPWAFSISRRLLVDQIRKSRREVLSATPEEPSPDSTQSNEPSAEALLHASEIAERVQAVLVTLPDTQREAFELLKIEELSVAEAADIVGATSAAVKLRAHRAYEAIRAALGDLAPAFEEKRAEKRAEKREAGREKRGEEDT